MNGDHQGIRPYLTILAVAVLIGRGLLLYLLRFMDEIRAIVTQSPT